MKRARAGAASIAIVTTIPMMAQAVAGRAIRDTLFLSAYDASHLPAAMMGAATLSLATAFSISRVMPRWGPRATTVVVSCVNGTLFAAEGALVDVAPKAVGALAYMHVGVVGLLVATAFSSVVNERFDPHYAKTVVSRIQTGAALGGVLGGIAALVLNEVLELSTLLYCLASLSAMVAVGAWKVGPSTQPTRATDTVSRTALGTIRADHYLRRVALIVMLLGVVGVFVSYAMKAEASLRFGDSASLLSFFTTYYMATAVLTFLTQASVTKPLLLKVGLGPTLAVLPVVVGLSAAVGAAWTRLWSATLARCSQEVFTSSVFRSGYELLYTPLPTQKKRGTKALIDIACNRIGYGAGSLIAMGVVATAATLQVATSWILGLAAVTAFVGAWLVRRLHDGYVRELATSLREGTVVLGSDDIVDATTLHTLAQSASVLDRAELLESIEAFELKRDAKQARRRRILTAQLADLLSDDPERVLNVLSDESLSWRLAPHVIDRLGTDAYAGPAYRALATMSPRITGQLVDAMLSSEMPPAVRRRIPRLLRKGEDWRAVRGLIEGLRDEEFDVRYRCGHALADLKLANPDLELPSETIMQAVACEVRADEAQWQHRRLQEEPATEPQSEIDALAGAREEHTLQHVFTLLGLALDRDAIVLSLRALSSDDENLRGTALEYLDNILPEEVREPLWPRLTKPTEAGRARSSGGPPDKLLQSMRSLLLDHE
jgi:HEAT repeat protein